MKSLLLAVCITLAINVDMAIGQTNTFPSSGSVGIGTTSPKFPLEVTGNVGIDGTHLIFNSASGVLDFGPSGGLYVRNLSTQGNVSTYTDLLTVTSSGNVGIGTINPLQKLSLSKGALGLDNFGFVSSYRPSQGAANTYTSLFLGGAIADNNASGGTDTFTVQGDGGSNFFAAIRMDSSGLNAGAINFFTGASTGGTSYTLTNAQLAGYQRMTIVGGNVGIGTANPQAKLEINGNLRFTSDGSVQTTAWTGVLCGGDYAEAVEAKGDRKNYEPGDVMILSEGKGEDVEKSSEPYSTMVAGIFATKPGVIGRRQILPASTQELPMAMIGIVPTKVTTENGAIRKGDLLVTSSKAGYAMRGTDRDKMLGAVIGKAMGSLDLGSGIIEVLVTLQ